MRAFIKYWKNNKGEYLLLLAVYPSLLFVFWLNEQSFHASFGAFSHFHCFLGLSILGWLSWMLQYILLWKIRNNDQVKLYHIATMIYYIAVVLLAPAFVIFLFLVFRFYFEIHFFIPKNLFAIILRLTSLSVMCNLLVDIFLMSKAKYNIDIKAQKLELAKQKAEMNMFKSELNPHFLFNTLNTLAYITKHDQQKAVQYSQQFANMYGHILTHLNNDWVALKEELDIIKNYFSLQQIRTGQLVHLDLEIDETNIEQYLIAPLSLQLLIENAIKHNAYSSSQELLIQILIENKYCVVKNLINPVETKWESTKMGLNNLKTRYSLITDKPVIWVNDGIFFTVKIPLKEI